MLCNNCNNNNELNKKENCKIELKKNEKEGSTNSKTITLHGSNSESLGTKILRVCEAFRKRRHREESRRSLSIKMYIPFLKGKNHCRVLRE